MPDAPTQLSSVRELKSLENGSGQLFTSLLVVRKLAAKTASNGNPFFSLELGDRTGSFGCTVFNDHPAFELLRNDGEGAVIRVEGNTDSVGNAAMNVELSRRRAQSVVTFLVKNGFNPKRFRPLEESRENLSDEIHATAAG